MTKRKILESFFSYPRLVNIGENTINRKSSDAQICKWFSQESVYYQRAMEHPRADNLKVCGWPANLLLPKGNTDGYPCQLFVMVSNDSVRGISFHYYLSYLMVIQFDFAVLEHFLLG